MPPKLNRVLKDKIRIAESSTHEMLNCFIMKDTISKKEIIRQLKEQEHPELVEDVIFWALQHYAQSEPKGTFGRIIASSIVQSIKEAENRIRSISN